MRRLNHSYFNGLSIGNQRAATPPGISLRRFVQPLIKVLPPNLQSAQRHGVTNKTPRDHPAHPEIQTRPSPDPDRR